MDAVLFICHGSRIPEARDQAVAFIKKCMANSPVPIQEYCFLELANPTLEKGFARCIERGATKIAVIPVLLLTAAHAKKDIPTELRRVGAHFPEIEVRYGRPIGVDESMVDILIEKIDKSEKIITEDSMAVLVGRGSSDPDVKRDLGLIAEMLKEKSGLRKVDISFLAVADPTLDESLRSAQDSKSKEIFVIPYLLFTGVLMKTIEQAVAKYNHEGKYILCDHLGYHPYIEQILRDRVTELLSVEV